MQPAIEGIEEEEEEEQEEEEQQEHEQEAEGKGQAKAGDLVCGAPPAGRSGAALRGSTRWCRARTPAR